ncbi:putative endo alpha-1,4-polygalactosaminidase [Leptodontidium sp. MPI-SDFR-AT-0119]|nr:putative endo alpha-1,4-polygalactosaminidase [Leptodontidium sp. MPI-SDFR-AT-0119]
MSPSWPWFSQHQQLKPEHEMSIPQKSRFGKRFWIILGSVILVIAIALGVGLGVGLTRNSGGGGGGGGDNSPQPPPVNNTNATEGTFWRPEAGTSWQIVLQYALNDTTPDVAVYDIDLFTNPKSTIDNLHSLGRKVICYFSAGSYEDFRPDSSDFEKSDYGKGLDGWPGEWWLNTSSTNVRKIMTTRIELAKTKGCDGVDPDNVDGYDNDTGFDLTKESAVDFMTFMAIEAHSRNMSIGLKNAGGIVNSTLPMMQWQVNEQCVQYDECDSFTPFITNNKPVFHIEYPKSAPRISSADNTTFCDTSTDADFSTLLKNMNLDNWYQDC